MRVLVLGANGMLGHKLVQKWQTEFDVFATVRGEFASYEHFGIFEKNKTFDRISAGNFETIETVVKKIAPQVIFNAIGIIKQLPTSKNVIKTLQINSIFPHQLAEVAEKNEARLINISTDCVFDGKKGNYTEADVPNATDVYGKSKNLGEVLTEKSLILRTSIIGRELSTAHSLVEWFLSNRGKTVKGFVNAIYTGFPTIVFADIIADLIKRQPDLRGLYHVSSEPINKFDLLNLIKKSYGVDIEIEPFEDFYMNRSLDSTEFRNQTGFEPLAWEKMVEKMAQDTTPYDSWRKYKKR